MSGSKKEALRRMRSDFVYRPVRKVASAVGLEIVRAGELPAPVPGDTPLRESFASNEANGLFTNEQILLTPREAPLQVEDLLRFFESEELAGIHIPRRKDADVKVCFLQRDKLAALRAIALFCAHEGARLRYRVRRKTWETVDLAKYMADFADVDHGMMTVVSLRSPEEFSFTIEFWTEEDDKFQAAGANYVSRRLWRSSAESQGFFAPGPMRDYRTLLAHPHETDHQFPIDLVFTWVNSEDPDWQELYNSHSPSVQRDGTSLSRFVSRDELKFALRSWDLYGTFIRNVYVVSNCAPPDWLDMENGRVRWVPHEDILPASVLPTFSSHTIESSLHRVPGIAEHFIYSNDDFFLTRPAYADDFYFPNGIAKLRLEPYGMVNGEVTRGHPDYLNGARTASEVIHQEFAVSPTQLVTHSPIACRREVMEEIESKYADYLARTRANKFRGLDDVAPIYLYAHYAINAAKAISDDTPVRLVQQNHRFRMILSDLVERKAQAKGGLPLSVCLNDGADSHLNRMWNTSVTSFLDDFFPDKSSFEKY